MKVLFILALCFALWPQSAKAAETAEHIGTISRVVGKVYLLANPSNKITGEPPHAKFEGKFYTERRVKRGMEIRLGEVIRTSKVGRAKIIYPNGDHFTVSTSTTFKVELAQNGGVRTPQVEVYSGKFRALIDAEGPRSGSKVRTRSAVMGVRGTDFFVNSYNKSGASEVTVVRGKVAVAARAVNGVQKKPVEVKAGYSAAIAAPKKQKREPGTESTKPVTPEVKIAKAEPEALVQLARASRIKPSESEPEEKIDPKVEEKVKQLERKAARNTVKDIKKYDPELYKSIQKSEKNYEDDFQVLDTILNTRIEEKSKPKPKKRAPKPELKNSDEDIYDKYYKN